MLGANMSIGTGRRTIARILALTTVLAATTLALTACDPTAVAVTVTGISQQKVLEGQSVDVTFQVANNSTNAISGWVQSSTTSNRVEVKDLAAGRTSAPATLRTIAPLAADAPALIKFYQDPGNAVLSSAPLDLIVGANFKISFDSFDIKDTRSPNDDTDTAWLLLATDDGGIGVPQNRPMGDLNNGHYDTGKYYTNVAIYPTTRLAVAIAVENFGNNDDANSGQLDSNLGRALRAFVQDAAKGHDWRASSSPNPYSMGPGLPYLTELTWRFYAGWDNRNCDGIVALNVYSWTGADVIAGVGANGAIREDRDYPNGTMISPERDLYVSWPEHCDGSNYHATMSITHM
jgi:hypothetical protein